MSTIIPKKKIAAAPAVINMAIYRAVEHRLEVDGLKRD